MTYPLEPPDRSPGRFTWFFRFRAMLRDGVEFVRDVFWLLGWGARTTLNSTNDGGPLAAQGARRRERGCLGCLVSILVIAVAGGVWRRARSRHRPR